MAKITLKLNQKDLQRILKNGSDLEKELMSEDGAVYRYMLYICDGYKEAVLSGIGTTSTGVHTLKEFLGPGLHVDWKMNSKKTLKHKQEMGWDLRIWKATGSVERNVKVERIKSSGKIKSVFAGIDDSDPEAFQKAVNTEFGGISDPGGKSYEGRALFTLLGAVFEASADKIIAEIEKKVAEAIENTWGR